MGLDQGLRVQSLKGRKGQYLTNGAVEPGFICRALKAVQQLSAEDCSTTDGNCKVLEGHSQGAAGCRLCGRRLSHSHLLQQRPQLRGLILVHRGFRRGRWFAQACKQQSISTLSFLLERSWLRLPVSDDLLSAQRCGSPESGGRNTIHTTMQWLE